MEALRVCPYRFRVATTYRIPTLTSRREFFRLPYPVTTGATLDVEGTNYKVGEVSERGLRIVSASTSFRPNAPVEGTLILTMGLRCTVSGRVLRIEDGAVVRQARARPHHLRRHSRTAASHQDVPGLEAAARLKMGTLPIS